MPHEKKGRPLPASPKYKVGKANNSSSDWRLTDQHTPDRRLTDQRTPDRRPPEQRSSNQRPGRLGSRPIRRIAAAISAAAIVAMLVALAVFLPKCSDERPDPADFQHATVDYVIDGDTIDVVLPSEDGNARTARVRLVGIDAPESANHDTSKNTPEGTEATEYLRSILPAGTDVYLQTDVTDIDKYDRLLRYVWLELPENPDDASELALKMLNARIVADGYADTLYYEPDVRYADEFEKLKKRAVSEGAGVSRLWK